MTDNVFFVLKAFSKNKNAIYFMDFIAHDF